MQLKPRYNWSDLKTLVPRKVRATTYKGAARRRAQPIPTLLLRANRYRGFALYVMSASGSTPVFRDGSPVWFKSISACADALLDLDVDLDFEHVLLDLGVWDCHEIPQRHDELRPARAQGSSLAKMGLRPVRPLGAQHGDRS